MTKYSAGVRDILSKGNKMKNQTEARQYCSYLGTGEKPHAANPRGVPPIRRYSSETRLDWDSVYSELQKKSLFRS
mgnify:CR=1 FL=1